MKNSSMIKKALPAAVVLACAGGLSTNANAAAYAIGYNNVFELSIISNPLLLPDAFSSFRTTSTSAANLNGSGPSQSATGGIGGILPGGGPADVGVATGPGSVFPGAAPGNNSMTQIGQGAGAFYSYADSEIGSTALLQVDPFNDPVSFTGNNTQAWGIAEAFVDAAAGTADSIAGNSSDTGFAATIEVGQGGTQFSFSFQADPYLFAEITNTSDVGGALAALSVSFTISDATGQVFTWSPDGMNEGAAGVGGSVGGMETADPFSLNTNVPASNVGDQVEYDPCGNGAPTGVINRGCANGSNVFSAQTGILGPGTYTISLNMTENVNVSSLAAPVPAPGVIALFGLGLLGLGMSRRRSIS